MFTCMAIDGRTKLVSLPVTVHPNELDKCSTSVTVSTLSGMCCHSNTDVHRPGLWHVLDIVKVNSPGKPCMI